MHWTNRPELQNHPGFENVGVRRLVDSRSKPSSSRQSYSRFPPIKSHRSSYYSTQRRHKKRKRKRKNHDMIGGNLLPMMIAMQGFRKKPQPQDDFAFEVQKIMERQETMLQKLQQEKMGNGPDRILLKKLNQLERRIEEVT